ncbi:hypothetical protein [Neobacillus massiliamazoniensis]|uniref:Uncharacterized protein n=1 Tax=Neobacillus massiliamazoniensis TaxID=1499688 RepID=A0A0U1NXY5_9BACI|nr:hypothetical protein [Neobacillus massiliamazoniensis]CRK82909.1 hypothetical protein BN000_02864 [Neobacillus massiliamazoniensis]
MNYKVLKDIKAMSGFVSTIKLSAIAVALAIFNISYWVIFVILSILVLSLSVFKADKLYNGNKDN